MDQVFLGPYLRRAVGFSQPLILEEYFYFYCKRSFHIANICIVADLFSMINSKLLSKSRVLGVHDINFSLSEGKHSVALKIMPLKVCEEGHLL